MFLLQCNMWGVHVCIVVGTLSYPMNYEFLELLPHVELMPNQCLSVLYETHTKIVQVSLRVDVVIIPQATRTSFTVLTMR